MMKHPKALAAAAICACLGLDAPARADTSADLIELCRKFLAVERPADGVVDTNFIQLKSSCSGFINSHVKMSKPEDGFCVPKGYNMDDLAQVYMAWVEKNPSRLSEPTKVTMTEALSERYPCAK